MNGTQGKREDRGIICPQCGCRHFDTTHTEPLRDGRIRRRKECRQCGRRVVTFESAPARTAVSHRHRLTSANPQTAANINPKACLHPFHPSADAGGTC